jgi:phosphatidylserine/phosphatidylglycerophosphate/cardiolipin synthase-like enzyme
VRSSSAAIVLLAFSGVVSQAGCRVDDASSAGTGAARSTTTTSTAGSGGGDATSSSSSSGNGGAPPACSVDVPRQKPLEAWAEPDASQAPFVDALSTAKSSIRVMVYEMGYGAILDTLVAKAKAGVSVRVILDTSKQSINQKYFDALTAAGATVEWSAAKFTYMHAKSIVIDDTIAVISTGNYLASQMAQERNYVVRDEDPSDVASLAAIFDADFAGTEPDVSCTRLVVSPVNARQRILDLIASATDTLDIESMQLADSDVRSAIAARKQAGVAVRVILADTAWIDTNADAAAFLAANQIQARYLSSPKVHVKAIAVDGQRAYLGSENLSYTSLSKNREIGVIAFEPAISTLMSQTFEADWAKATPF